LERENETSEKGRFLPLSHYLYKPWLNDRLWGNTSHSSVSCQSQMPACRTSGFGQNQAFTQIKNGDPEIAAVDTAEAVTTLSFL